MKKIALLFLAMVVIGGCSGAQIRSDRVPVITKKDPVLAVSGKKNRFTQADSVLAESLAERLRVYGFDVVEKKRLRAAMDELGLDERSIRKEWNVKKIGSLLDVDAFVFVSEPDGQSSIINSAQARVVDAKTGQTITNIDFENAWAGLKELPLDMMVKGFVSKSAEIIAKEIAKIFGKI